MSWQGPGRLAASGSVGAGRSAASLRGQVLGSAAGSRLMRSGSRGRGTGQGLSGTCCSSEMGSCVS